MTLAVVDAREAIYLNNVPGDVEIIDLGCRRVRYALPKIIALIWKRRPDAVFSTIRHLNLALAMLRPLLPRNTRLIARETSIISQTLVIHGSPWLWRWMYRRFFRNHDVVICQSRAMLDDIVTNYAFPRERTVLIHNPVDVEQIRQLTTKTSPDDYPQFQKNSDCVQLIAAGRLAYEKGFDLLIEALALLNSPQVRLTILGEGPLRTCLEKLTQVRGVEKRVRFADFQENPFSWFARADAFVLSSRFEGFPNVVLEALVCGTPVVATPAKGGTREILDGIPQCVVAREVSSHALADAIDEWLGGSRDPVPENVVAPYRLSTIIPRYERLLRGELEA